MAVTVPAGTAAIAVTIALLSLASIFFPFYKRVALIPGK